MVVICFAFSIAHQDNFYFLNQGECPYVNEVDDVEGFEEMREAMDLVGIMEDQQLMIFRILAGILHIGNIDIHPSGEEESEIDVRHIHLFVISEKCYTSTCRNDKKLWLHPLVWGCHILFWGQIGLGFNNLLGAHR